MRKLLAASMLALVLACGSGVEERAGHSSGAINGAPFLLRTTSSGSRLVVLSRGTDEPSSACLETSYIYRARFQAPPCSGGCDHNEISTTERLEPGTTLSLEWVGYCAPFNIYQATVTHGP